MVRLVLALAAAVLLFSTTAEARNTPCSGKKGGVARCDGPHFICNDGSVSRSQQTCSSPETSTDETEDTTAPAAAGKSSRKSKATRRR